MTRPRHTDTVAEMVAQALATNLAEEVDWDVTMVMGEQGAALLVVVNQEGAVLSTRNFNHVVLPFDANQGLIDQAVRQMLDSLAAARSAQLANPMASPRSPLLLPNGHGH